MKHMEDISLDDQYSISNNEILQKLWSESSRNSLLKMVKLFGKGNMKGITDGLQAFERTKILHLNKQEDINSAIKSVRTAKAFKGIEKRKRSRIIRGTEINLRKNTKKVIQEREDKRIQYISENMVKSMDENTFGTNSKSGLETPLTISSFSEKNMPNFSKTKVEKPTNSGEIKTTNSGEIKYKKSKIKENSEKSLYKECAKLGGTVKDTCTENEDTIILNGRNCCLPENDIKKPTNTENKKQKKTFGFERLNAESTVGGGNKSVELTMRNEVLNDSQLRKELVKFENKYKSSEILFKKQILFLLFTIVIGLALGSYFDLITCYFGNFDYVWVGPPFTLLMNFAVFYLIFSANKEK